MKPYRQSEEVSCDEQTTKWQKLVAKMSYYMSNIKENTKENGPELLLWTSIGLGTVFSILFYPPVPFAVGGFICGFSVLIAFFLFVFERDESWLTYREYFPKIFLLGILLIVFAHTSYCLTKYVF